MPIDYSKLQEPFESRQIEWRPAGGDQNLVEMVAYVDSRRIQTRLDSVCGPDRWRVSYKEGPKGGVMCTLGILSDDGEWVDKADGAENTDVEEVKGGYTDSFKRAAVAWGIGRYLYFIGIAKVKPVDPKTPGAMCRKVKGNFVWIPTPTLPDWARPIDWTWLNRTLTSMESSTVDAIAKFGAVLAGDRSINDDTRELCRERLLQIYKLKKEQANDSGGVRGDGKAHA